MGWMALASLKQSLSRLNGSDEPQIRGPGGPKGSGKPEHKLILKPGERPGHSPKAFSMPASHPEKLENPIVTLSPEY